ncbi:unnamed protein product [Caenorhabditis brenneri]
MSQLLFWLFTSLALVALCTTYPISESSENDSKMSKERNLIDALNTLLEDHKHTIHRSRRRCGGRAVKKINEVCPDGCSRRDDLLVIEMCSPGLENKDILARCCP